MITALELENFKGVGPRQRIEFAPLTLLFGANSAGKSSLLHALVYLSDVLERGSADVDRTELGGDALDFGGFGRLVHGHRLSRRMSFRVEFDTPATLNRLGRDLSGSSFLSNLDDAIGSAWVELSIRRISLGAFEGALVDDAAIGVAGEAAPLVWLELGSSLREGEPFRARINLRHPAFEDVAAELDQDWQDIALRDAWKFSSFSELVREHDEREEAEPEDKSRGSTRSLVEEREGMPVFALSRSRDSVLPPIDEPIRVVVPEASASTDEPEAAGARAGILDELRALLEMLIVGTTSQLRDALRDALYVGPLREVPPRGFLYERSGRLSSWAGGLGAWELLLADRGPLVERTNTWLERLNANTQLRVQHLQDPSAEAEAYVEAAENVGVRRLLLDAGSGTGVLPSEVGAGISQLVPVIVSSLVPRKSGLLMIEQPEIHIHPALQAEVGDLLIEATERRQLIVETHSEHVVLRVLRRVRETSAKELPDGAPAFTPERLCVVWVEGGPGGTKVQRLRVDETGEFIDRWPKGFFEERAKELF